MSNQTEIVNLALAHIAVNSITDIDELSTPAREAKRIWDIVVDEVLSDNKAQWSFATYTTTLAQLEDAPIIKYSYAYQLPTDFLRLIELNDANEYEITAYNVQGRSLLCDTDSPVYITYVQRISEPENFSPKFASCLSARLAYYLANKLAKDKGAQDRCDKLYNTLLSESVHADIENMTDEDRIEGSWIQKRLY